MLIRRDSSTGANDLITVYRPCTVDEMLGNKTNVNMLRKGLSSGDLPHTFLFTGDPGCGKTTAARIIALGLNCEAEDQVMTTTPCLECVSCSSILNQNSLDLREINVGMDGGKDAVTAVVRELPSAPFGSRYKVLIFDEAHKLTPASQDLLLKVIEDGYHHVYFIFCTNKPEKLTDAFIGRCNVMHFSRVSGDLILNLLENVAQFEGMEYNSEILKYIANEARGVPRSALVWLKQVNDEGTWTKEAANQIISISLDAEDPKIVEISKALLKGNFSQANKAYEKIKKKYQAEQVRIGIVSYLVGCLKRARSYKDADKFSAALDIAMHPIYEKGKPGDYKLFHYLFKIARVLQ